MVGPGRNDPCPCGSGRKTKRCCGQRRGPSEEQLTRARLASLARDAAEDLVGLSQDGLIELREDIFTLPEIDLSLHVRLPELAGSERRRLQRAITDPDDEGAWESVRATASRVDTPQERVRLAEALTRLREEGFVGHLEAAAAIYDLGSGGSYFITTSTIHALATVLGGDPTPSGLLVAA